MFSGEKKSRIPARAHRSFAAAFRADCVFRLPLNPKANRPASPSSWHYQIDGLFSASKACLSNPASQSRPSFQACLFLNSLLLLPVLLLCFPLEAEKRLKINVKDLCIGGGGKRSLWRCARARERAKESPSINFWGAVGASVSLERAAYFKVSFVSFLPPPPRLSDQIICGARRSASYRRLSKVGLESIFVPGKR